MSWIGNAVNSGGWPYPNPANQVAYPYVAPGPPGPGYGYGFPHANANGPYPLPNHQPPSAPVYHQAHDQPPPPPGISPVVPYNQKKEHGYGMTTESAASAPVYHQAHDQPPPPGISPVVPYKQKKEHGYGMTTESAAYSHAPTSVSQPAWPLQSAGNRSSGNTTRPDTKVSHTAEGTTRKADVPSYYTSSATSRTPNHRTGPTATEPSLPSPSGHKHTPSSHFSSTSASSHSAASQPAVSGYSSSYATGTTDQSHMAKPVPYPSHRVTNGQPVPRAAAPPLLGRLDSRSSSGSALPPDRRMRGSSPSPQKDEEMNACPICQQLVPMKDWIQHATSHGKPQGQTKPDLHTLPAPSSYTNKPRPVPSANLRPTTPVRVSNHIGYLLIDDILKDAQSDPSVLDNLSCQLCCSAELKFEGYMRHIQYHKHMEALLNWLGDPTNSYNGKYRQLLPQSIRGVKYFCEICCVVVCEPLQSINKHYDSAHHAKGLAKIRESLQWIQRAQLAREERYSYGEAYKHPNAADAGAFYQDPSPTNISSGRPSNPFAIAPEPKFRASWEDERAKLAPEAMNSNPYSTYDPGYKYTGKTHPIKQSELSHTDKILSMLKESPTEYLVRKSAEQPPANPAERYLQTQPTATPHLDRRTAGSEGYSPTPRGRSHSHSPRRRTPSRSPRRYRRSTTRSRSRSRSKRRSTSRSSYRYPRNSRRSTSPRNQRKSTTTESGKKRRRLSPANLDDNARDALTKKIETTWQNYYHKYYSCINTNPEIVLEMQKEYLRSYKGFFKEDPCFEYYYVKVAKPEDIREALTLRIDRGSPGPDPTDPSYSMDKSSRDVIPKKARDKAHGSPTDMRQSYHRSEKSYSRRSPHRGARDDYYDRRRHPDSPLLRRSDRRSRHDSREPRSRRWSPGEERSRRRSPIQERRKRRSPSPRSPRRDRSTQQLSDEGKSKHHSLSGDINQLPLSQRTTQQSPDNQQLSKPDGGHNRQGHGQVKELLSSEKDSSKQQDHKEDSTSGTEAMNDARTEGLFHSLDDILKDAEVSRLAEQLLKASKTKSSESEDNASDVLPSEANLPKVEEPKEKPKVTLPRPILKKEQLIQKPRPIEHRPGSQAGNFELASRANTDAGKLQEKGVNPTGDISEQKEIAPNKVEDRFPSATLENRNKKPDQNPSIPIKFDSSHNEPVITSTTGSYNNPQSSEKPKSVLDRLGSQWRGGDDRFKSLDDSLSTSTNAGTEITGQIYDHRRVSKDRRSNSTRLSSQDRTSKSTSSTSEKPSSDPNLEIFADPFLGFVHRTLTGIILIGQYQQKMAAGNQSVEVKEGIAKEQKTMHDRMVTPDGHLLIRLARCCLRKSADIPRLFPHVHTDIGSILGNLDPQIIKLIADTPIIM